MQHSLDILGAGLFAFAGAALILLGIARWTRAPVVTPARHPPAAFLFEGPDLVDASPVARRILDGPTDLSSLLALLSRGFGRDLGHRIAALAPAGQLRLASSSAGILDVEAEGSRLRLVLHPNGETSTALERLSLDAAREELALLHGIAEAAPQPVWAVDPDDRLVWANRSYLDLARSVEGIAASRPGDLHRTVPLFALPTKLDESGIHRRREALTLPGREEPSWFEVTTVARGPGTFHFATDVSALVLAESTRLRFVQALAKTFAHLPTGLAIFDRQRRLVLFNPAFVDLTRLPIDFLSGRPLVHSVLDRLRESEMLPEPRDYAAWREEVAALEAAAARGTYNETWNLPGGRIYRVTGRPHPDGALALLFEDISGEVGLVRHLRAELDTAHAALGALAEAAAVFGATGALSLSNAAYAALWGSPPSGANLPGEVARWQAACAPSPLWTRLVKDLRGLPSSGNLRRPDGRDLRMEFTPLLHGATLVTFRTVMAWNENPHPVGTTTSSSLRPQEAVHPQDDDALQLRLLATEDL